ncbi:helicase [Aerococcus agrisoli]|uniref:Helicase n=1 Tax=Aerococcus agrisoli TaxID=2487350 RepID=A0A3N4GBG4_9LACT|nr:DEAD/DEAH box helicase family protein [Aerococcus agrisoli]RPA56371.1 helicase [Aerococcus agrisoli]
MGNNNGIKTTKLIYPQIYAYTLPTIEENIGWIKIGYTEREDAEQRIKEQTQTAAIQLEYDELWVQPAFFDGTDNFFTDKQFHSYLRKYKLVPQRGKREWFYYNGTPKKSLDDLNDFKKQNFKQIKEEAEYVLRPEQESAVEKTLAYARKHEGGRFLWNAKPRFGKTLTTYDLARKLEAEKVLIVTNRPAIANSWFDDFEKFIAWQTDYVFLSNNESLKNRPAFSREQYLKQLDSENPKEKMITFVSLQDLKGAISFGGKHDKLNWIKNLKWDLLVIDESHEGIDTIITDVAFDQLERKFTLYLSGTPFKAIASGDFTEEQIYNWTYADEQTAKKHWQPDWDEENPYNALPQLNLFSYQMSQAITDEVNKGADIEGKNLDYAFDLNEFFETNEAGKFIHESDIIKWLDTLTHNEKYPFSTPELRNELKHTFWYLNRVASAKALEKLLKKHPVFENYHIIVAAGDGKTEDDQIINTKALERVREAINNNDKTITLSVGQLTTGVTVPEWTGVLMLSNLQSPSVYMQAAFRAQNPWTYKKDGKVYQKQNAYVFDFAPERTLIIYDEFANNLSRQTVNGGGTTDKREENIKQLLNFFPVIAEDNDGKMIELDANQVMTIPKSIKAQEVVKRGFISNLLFQNISGIFASAGAREILEQLNPVAQGTYKPNPTDSPIDTQNVQVDQDGGVVVDPTITIATTKAHFGDKLYEEIKSKIDNAIDSNRNDKYEEVVTELVEETLRPGLEDVAKDIGISKTATNGVIKEEKAKIARTIEIIAKNTEIKHNEAQVEYKRELAEAKENEEKITKAKKAFEEMTQKIDEEEKQSIEDNVVAKLPEIAQKSTENILKVHENKKKNHVEDEVRARLRGFARTIPSFLMAYGEESTNLDNFDLTIDDSVFKEVTGITLGQFRQLRDTYHFFDPIVFDESCQEFLKKRADLSNYFDENQEEDIFDYIPPQKTNQIYTPKKVVIMMIDQLEVENPGIFSDPDKTFADLYVKSGLYLTEIVKRLFIGLEEIIPNEEERLKHILEHQVYGFAPSEIIYNIAKNFVFGFDKRAENIDTSHLVLLDTTPYAKSEGDFEAKLDELFGGNQ